MHYAFFFLVHFGPVVTIWIFTYVLVMFWYIFFGFFGKYWGCFRYISAFFFCRCFWGAWVFWYRVFLVYFGVEVTVHSRAGGGLGTFEGVFWYILEVLGMFGDGQISPSKGQGIVGALKKCISPHLGAWDGRVCIAISLLPKVVFALLLPGHRMAPSMVVPYKRMCWLANIARVPGTAQVITQAVWEHTEKPKGTGPLGQALREFRRLGWRNQRGWWSWTMPRTGISVHLVHAAKEYVEHLFRESLREHHLEALEKRRPRLFGGMGARIDRELTLSELERCATELDRSMLRGVMAGALCTADRAHRRGLRQDGNCPYCSKGTREDEDHLLWWCAAWKSAREPFLPELMLLARALKLGALSDWPPCLRLCGLLSEEVVKRSGLARGPGWKKRCKELNRVSRHWVPGPGEDPDEASRQREELALAGHQWAHDDQNPLEQFVHQLHCMFLAVLRARKQRDEEESLLFPVEQRKAPQEQYPWHQLQSPFPRPTKTCLPAMGQLPRDWKWGPDFQPAVLRWLSELQWLPRDDSLPEAHRQVSFLELALDFESYTGRPLPPTPQTRFKGGEMSLQEKGRVLRLAVSLLGKAAGRESILPAGFTNRCRSLVPLGAGTMAGVKGRPIFTRPAAVWHHLRRMQQYSAKRWAQQQQAKVAPQQSKHRRAQGVKVKSAPAQ